MAWSKRSHKQAFSMPQWSLTSPPHTVATAQPSAGTSPSISCPSGAAPQQEMSTMTHHPLRELLTVLVALIVLVALPACTDNGGDRAPGVEPGPTPPNGPIVPPPPIISDSIAADDISADDTLTVTINDVSYDDADKLILNFSVVANGAQSVTGLSSSNLGFSLARLLDNPGDSAGQRWSSYILTQEDPVCRDGNDVTDSNNDCTTFETATDPDRIGRSDLKVRDGADDDDSNGVAIGKVVVSQATTETSNDDSNASGNGGQLVAEQDGSWSYTYDQDSGDPSGQNNVHRACIQFSFNAELDSICVDLIPSAVADADIGADGSSLADDFYDNHSARQIAVEATCNTCHDKLALHGGRRTTIDYCVTCHNPDTTDANSTNTMDLKVLVHKLHNGKNLPALSEDGKAYKVWGFRNGEYDYSSLSYPQKMIHCSRCHAGQEDIEFAQSQGLPMPTATITADGHSWVSNPTLTACTSCHEKLVSENKNLDGSTPSTDHTSYTESTNCAGCHRDRGPTEPGRLQADQAHRDLADEAGLNLDIVIEKVTDTDADAGQTPQVTFSIQDASGRKLDLQNNDDMCRKAKWDLRMPYDAAGEYLARISGSGKPDDLTEATPGSNDFIMEPSSPMPADVDTITAMIDWNFPFDCDEESEKARLNAALSYESSPPGSPTARRTITAVTQCNNCHYRMLETPQKHGGTRSVNSPEACVACHNAEFATSDRSREMAVMTHALHASGIRDSAHGSYDKERLQYPGDLSDCNACHVNNSQLLPLPAPRQAIRSTSGPTYTSPIAAICSACHDDSVAQSHMETSGGAVFNDDFATANVTESCDVCHGTGKSADVDRVHNK